MSQTKITRNPLLPGSDNLKGQSVLITGAAGAIGKAAAEAFAREGCELLLVDINEPALQQTVSELKEQYPVAIVGQALNLAEEQSMEMLLQTAQSHFGGIDILINNAGIVTGGQFIDTDPQLMKSLLLVNLYAPLRLCQLFVPGMQRQGGGHIINVYSSAALLSMPGFAAYGASKAGLFAFTRTLRRELHGSGIFLTALCPGSTTSAMTRGMIKSGKATGRQPHHSPDVPAAAMVRAVKKKQGSVIISSQKWAQSLITLLDRLCPDLLDNMWLKMADKDYYDCVSLAGRTEEEDEGICRKMSERI